MKLNKSNIMASTWIVPVSVLLFWVVFIGKFDVSSYLVLAITGFVTTLILWIPVLIIYLIFEQFLLRRHWSKYSVIGIFVLEVLVTLLLVHFIFSYGSVFYLMPLGASLLLGQLLRWLYLNGKNRIFLEPDERETELLDN